MISNFKLFPNFNISQKFVQNVQKQKNTFILSWDAMCSKLMEIREISWSLVSIKKSFRFYGEEDYRNLVSYMYLFRTINHT